MPVWFFVGVLLMIDEVTWQRQKKCAESWQGHDFVQGEDPYNPALSTIKKCVKCGLIVRNTR